jgi:hypothetical protein
MKKYTTPEVAFVMYDTEDALRGSIEESTTVPFVQEIDGEDD